MDKSGFREKASDYLHELCSVQPNRRTGSQGNRDATGFFAGIVRRYGYTVDTTSFPCLDYVSEKVSLTSGSRSYGVYISPYSLGCDVTAELIAASSIEQLETCRCEGKLLLMTGDLCAEQLMPKNFVFYNPDHHKRLISLLEEKKPSGIIAATEKKPDQVGALYPFPLIVDGDFHIPCVHCKDSVGEEVAEGAGRFYALKIDAERIPSTASNVVARKNSDSRKKIVITAHIDAYEDSPGASDNASGSVVQLLLAEMLSDYDGKTGIEIAAFNGEDHYSAGGQMDYLGRYGKDFDSIVTAINVDDVGYRKGKSVYSFYECDDRVKRSVRTALSSFESITEGESWYNGDHMIFVQSGKAAVAFTAEELQELMADVTHTSRDTPDIVDCGKLVEVAFALKNLILELTQD